MLKNLIDSSNDTTITIPEYRPITFSKYNNGFFIGDKGLRFIYTKDQKINLPVVKIKDYPSLKYRSIHIDVKHHTEKKEYYFKLIDELASIKINGIIVEFEDKLGYERRPTIAAPDSYSISWWKSLSEYANERLSAHR